MYNIIITFYSRKYEAPQNNEEALSKAPTVLYALENVKLGWDKPDEWSVGAGMMNMGNTCYLNSTLQALFHVPALVNWLLSDKQHLLQCENNSGREIFQQINTLKLEFSDKRFIV